MPAGRILQLGAKGIGRVESCAVQFGDDWPGLFLRGDHALVIAMSVRQLEKSRSILEEDRWAWERLTQLATLIETDVDQGPRGP